MIVSKCDKCNAEYREGEYPDWLQITADRGVMIINANKSVVKFGVLDFCCPDCARDFLAELAASMKPIPQVVE